MCSSFQSTEQRGHRYLKRTHNSSALNLPYVTPELLPWVQNRSSLVSKIDGKGICCWNQDWQHMCSAAEICLGRQISCKSLQYLVSSTVQPIWMDYWLRLHLWSITRCARINTPVTPIPPLVSGYIARYNCTLDILSSLPNPNPPGFSAAASWRRARKAGEHMCAFGGTECNFDFQVGKVGCLTRIQFDLLLLSCKETSGDDALPITGGWIIAIRRAGPQLHLAMKSL